MKKVEEEGSNLSQVKLLAKEQIGSVRYEEVERIVKERKKLWSCRKVDEYEKLNNISEGAYGIVSRGRCVKTNQTVALKRLKKDRMGKDGFPLVALREIDVLLNLKHRNLVDLKEVVSGKDSLFIVMEYLPHGKFLEYYCNLLLTILEDLRALMDGMPTPFRPSEVKCLMLQLLAGVQVCVLCLVVLVFVLFLFRFQIVYA